jgi:hypothetical protein
MRRYMYELGTFVKSIPMRYDKDLLHINKAKGDFLFPSQTASTYSIIK